MDKWKSKNSYKIMKWMDDSNFDYSDQRCSGDNSVAVQVLPVLTKREFNWVLIPNCDMKKPYHLDGNYELEISRLTCEEWDVAYICNAVEPTISAAITNAVLHLIDLVAETT